MRLTHYAGAAAVSALSLTLHGAPSQKPNILFLNADDFGVMNVGFDGDKRFTTPNLDKLAQEGMIFTNAFSAAANCAPSRACALTGQSGPRHGVYTVKSSARGDARFRKLIPIKNNTTVSLDNVLIPEALKPDGYTTIHIGKWHIGNKPEDQGFEISIGGKEAAPDYGGYYGPFKKDFGEKYNKNYPNNAEGVHLSDVFIDEAIKLFNDKSIEPFYMQIDFHLIHTPLHKVKEYYDKYKDRDDVLPDYASMIEKLDHGIGRIVAALKEAGIMNNTLIVFTSDNGAIRKSASQAPYRAGKGSYYDGGIRVPLFAVWLGKIQPGTKCDTPVDGLDLYPTFLAAAGAEKPKGKILDGVNILPLMTQTGTIPERNFYWHFPIYLQSYGGVVDEASDVLFRTRPGSVIISGNWKLHQYFEDGRLELYNLKDDIGEKHNLADEMPEKAKELLAKLDEWRKQVKAPIPTEKNSEYDPAAEKEAVAVVKAGGTPDKKGGKSKNKKKKKGDKKNKKNKH